MGWTAGFMQGFQYQVAAPAYLESLSILTSAGGMQAHMALYKNDGTGKPGSLISGSSPRTNVTGRNTFPVNPVLLTPRNFWIVLNGNGGSVSMWRGPSNRNYVAFTGRT